MAQELEYKKSLSSNLSNKDSFMNAYLFHGPKDIRYEKIPIPEISENEMLVKVETVLTCGTDLKTYERGHPVLIKSTPSLFGHQFSGTIVKVGEKVKGFHVSQNVIPINSAPCFNCRFCIKERFNLCENIIFLNGAYAEYVVIPERIVKHNTYEIPKGVNFDSAAALESIAVVLHGLEKSEVYKGKTICIIGTGSIGLLFCAIANLRGAKVISIGRKENKLKIAKELGASFTLNKSNFSTKDELKLGLRNLIGDDPEIVIEAAGHPESWQLALELVRKGGLVNFFGGCKKDTKIEVDTYRLHYEELKLIGTFHHTPYYIKEALNLLGEFQSKISRKIITHSFLLKELEKAFLLQKSGEVIQAAIKPQ